MPLNNHLVSEVYRPIDSYLSFFSIFQSWTMFSPNPARTDVHITAEVEFDDGSHDTYYFPNSSEMGIFEKYVNGERYRVLTEAIRRDDNSFLWKDAAKFSLRKLKDNNFNKIPLKVHLYRHWKFTPDIKQRFIPHMTKNESYESYKFFTYEVL